MIDDLFHSLAMDRVSAAHSPLTPVYRDWTDAEWRRTVAAEHVLSLGHRLPVRIGAWSVAEILPDTRGTFESRWESSFATGRRRRELVIEFGGDVYADSPRPPLARLTLWRSPWGRVVYPPLVTPPPTREDL